MNCVAARLVRRRGASTAGAGHQVGAYEAKGLDFNDLGCIGLVGFTGFIGLVGFIGSKGLGPRVYKVLDWV